MLLTRVLIEEAALRVSKQIQKSLCQIKTPFLAFKTLKVKKIQANWVILEANESNSR